MSHSLKCKLGNLRYKGIISNKDYDRLCKALDNEKMLDRIRTEIIKGEIVMDIYDFCYITGNYNDQHCEDCPYKDKCSGNENKDE